MKVADLIATLSTFSPDDEVYFDAVDNEYTWDLDEPIVQRRLVGLTKAIDEPNRKESACLVALSLDADADADAARYDNLHAAIVIRAHGDGRS